MRIRLLILAVVLLLLAPLANAQGKAGNTQPPEKQDRQRIQATGEQRHLYNKCMLAADRVRRQAREISRDSEQPSFSSNDARQHREKIRTELVAMEQEHARFLNGLTAEQRTAMQSQIDSLKQTHERLQLRLRELDGELGATSIASSRVRERAREVERSLKEWQKTHRQMGSELGV